MHSLANQRTYTPVAYADLKRIASEAATQAGLRFDQAVLILGTSPRRNARRSNGWSWQGAVPARVESTDWEQVLELWLSSREARRGEVLVVFAVDGEKYTAMPVSWILNG